MVKLSKDIERKIRSWEQQNMVYGKGYMDKTTGNGKSLSDNMQRRGYDAMRISPTATTKFGLKYRKVFGTAVEPNFSMTKKGQKFYPKVTWHLQGYIKYGKASGSKMLNGSSLRQNFQSAPLKSQLMIRTKKRK